jgi:hypothetical protein
MIRCSKVGISGTEISELNGEKIVAAIPREQIRQIKLCYESGARYPFSQYFLGYVLLIFGAIGLLVDFLAATGGRIHVPVGSGEIVLPVLPIVHWLMIGVGFWLLGRVFRPRYHLSVETEKGTRKIFFEKRVKAEEIQQFIRQAELHFGYTIDISVLKKKKPA